MDAIDTAELLRKLEAPRDLTREEASGLFDAIMDGRVAPDRLAELLKALAAKGECVDEIVGAAQAMRRRATPVRLPPGVEAIDTCGTGGDGQPLFNVSTTVAIVAAAAGATVAKHGNRSNVRPSGSVEGLTCLGVNVDADVPVVERCLRECHIGFLHAQRLHPAMRHAAPVRRSLGIRTIFNLLGPLTNPAGVRRQLVGVNRPELVEPMALALQALGAQRAMVVHGLVGLCDFSLSGASRVARLDAGSIQVEEIRAEAVGLAAAELAELCVSSPEDSAARILAVLAGQLGPPRDLTIFNTAAALWVAGLAEDWREGIRRASQVLDNGSAAQTLRQWRLLSHAPAVRTVD